ncbi:hypothetical protein HRI_003899300 [Hibiscus trionum]|uniref:Reverse transcriptase domain-containing protein n=1 Tax=Hibiscus trionum TaxID=183268 RepID=A0A9W7ITU8_HIBTR|nr:hypothetical protein HRI_003899300 [Hibiscus trionum]
MKTPVGIEDFRPISLVGSLYKILARVLSRRLAGCISEVKGEQQFSFIPDKQIVDCALIVNEIVDELKRNKREAVIFKADFRRAYDTVDWNFLDFIMGKMGFGKKWRKWIQLCISTPSISILINGSPSIKLMN